MKIDAASQVLITPSQRALLDFSWQRYCWTLSTLELNWRTEEGMRGGLNRVLTLYQGYAPIAGDSYPVLLETYRLQSFLKGILKGLKPTDGGYVLADAEWKRCSARLAELEKAWKPAIHVFRETVWDGEAFYRNFRIYASVNAKASIEMAQWILRRQKKARVCSKPLTLMAAEAKKFLEIQGLLAGKNYLEDLG